MEFLYSHFASYLHLHPTKSFENGNNNQEKHEEHFWRKLEFGQESGDVDTEIEPEISTKSVTVNKSDERPKAKKNILTKLLADTTTIPSPSVVLPYLPTYTKSDVETHNSKGTRIWTSLGEGVYDITNFIAKHPGSAKRILLASGNSLEPYFELCPVHFRNDNTWILEQFRIGNLHPDDKFDLTSLQNSWKDEPQRHPSVITHSYEPFTCESPLSALCTDYFTPNELFFVRNHYPIPKITSKSYRLQVEGIRLTSTSFTLQQLKNKFKRTEVTAVIQCAGNRQAEMMAIRPIGGKSWGGGGIGNAKWAGVKLKELLIASGFKKENYEHDLDKFHIEFEGLDKDQTGEGYACSIPLTYILDDNFDGLLAYEMNGDVLPLDYGYPVRVLLPGIVGARHVKWLGTVRILDHQSTSPWQRKDNKIFREPVKWDSIDYNSVPPIYDVPVTSFVCSHRNGDKVNAGETVIIRGYAYSGGSRSVMAVDVTTDNGKTWKKAKLIQPVKKLGVRSWSWVLWETDLKAPVSTAVGDYCALEVCVRATDSAWNTQPEELGPLWNYRGYLTNAWSKIKLEVICCE